MMTYEEARRFTEEAAGRGSVLGLSSIRRLMRALGDVQEQIPIVHIAGTNGKGSVGAYLEAVFREAGFSAGRYCSPAVFDPLEVWQYNGRNMSREEYAEVMSQVKEACGIVVSAGHAMPTVFEIETAAAFVWFSGKKPDVVFLETGMGGSTDATNLITKPLASVITSIGRDHMQFLGNRIEEIAAAKAGIIKPGCPVFSAPQEPKVREVLQSEARQQGAGITFVEETAIVPVRETPGCLEFDYTLSAGGRPLRLHTQLSASYQKKNAALAAETAAVLLPELSRRRQERLSKEAALSAITEGIRRARWRGRFEILGTQPLFIMDGAHNENAAAELAATVRNYFTNTPLTYIIGVLADKEYEEMLRLMLPYAGRVYTVTPPNPRALDAEALAGEARRLCAEAEVPAGEERRRDAEAEADVPAGEKQRRDADVDAEASAGEQQRRDADAEVPVGEERHRCAEVEACGEIGRAVELALRGKAPVLAFGSLSYLGVLEQEYRRLAGRENSEKQGKRDLRYDR